MGVYIKGMEMPTPYRTYKVRFAESGDGKIIVGIANEDSTAYRPIGEAIPVLPHGDLIDRDALCKAILNQQEMSDIAAMDLTRYIGQLFAKLVIDAPTIIESEGEK